MAWFSRKSSAEDRTLTRGNVPAPMLDALTTRGADDFGIPKAVTCSNAMTVADVYACVRALADAAASLPLIVYRRTENGRQRLDNRTAGLLRNPAPAVTQANLVGQLVAHLNLNGNAYLGKFRDADGRVAQLGSLSPDRVRVEVKGGMPLYTVTDPGNGRQTTHGTADIVHVKALGTDGLVGLSPVSQCRVALGLSKSLTHHASAFFANSGRPTGILKLPEQHSSDQGRHLRSLWDVQYKGVDNAHKVAIISGDIEWVPMAVPLDDMQFLEQRELSATEVARIFRVPPWVVGAKDGGSMTYANVQQQAEAFLKFSLQPWLTIIEQALSADPDLFTSPTYCEFLVDALLRSDATARSEVYAKALDPVTGWMTRDEVRRLENLAPETDNAPAPAQETNG